MAVKKDRKWARISEYADIVIPVEKLPQFLNYAKLVKTEYVDDGQRITEVRDVGRVEIFDESEITDAEVMAKLRGE